MFRPRALLALTTVSLAGGAAAQTELNDVAALRNEVAAMKAELIELRAQQAANEASWMDPSRSAEAAAVADDATGSLSNSLASTTGAPYGGYFDKKFGLAGEGFTLNIGGQLQFRWASLFNENQDDEDNNREGFEFRRLKLAFSGNIADPKLGYKIVLRHSRSSGNTDVEDAIISYKFSDALKASAGLYKLPFAREELLSSTRQLAADRGLATEFFTLNRSEQVGLSGGLGESLKYWASYSDGANEDGFGARNALETDESTEFAFTGRVEAKLAGDWKQAKDIVAWDDDFALFVGGAAHFQQEDTTDEELFAYTADFLATAGSLAINGAFYGATGEVDDRDQIGFLAQAGLNLTEEFQVFGRYDYIDDDINDVQAVTAGFNYFFKKHAAKFTLDGVVVLDPEPLSAISGLNGGQYSSGLALSSSALDQDENLYALRAQFQLLF